MLEQEPNVDGVDSFGQIRVDSERGFDDFNLVRRGIVVIPTCFNAYKDRCEWRSWLSLADFDSALYLDAQVVADCHVRVLDG